MARVGAVGDLVAEPAPFEAAAAAPLRGDDPATLNVYEVQWSIVFIMDS
jgi:hypothetical protein